MDTGPRLDARLLVGAEDVVLGAQGLALPAARVQVQDRPGFLDEAGVAREDPVLVLPGLDGIAVQDPPHRTAADGLAQSLPNPSRDIGQGLAAQGLLGLGHQLTGGGLDQRPDPGGKTRPCGRVRGCRPRRNRPRPSADASAAPGGPRGRLDAPPPPDAKCGFSCSNEDEAATLDGLLRCGLPPQGGTGFGQEVFGKRRANRQTEGQTWRMPFPTKERRIRRSVACCRTSLGTLTSFVERTTKGPPGQDPRRPGAADRRHRARRPARTGPPPRPPTASSATPGSTRASSSPGTSRPPRPGSPRPPARSWSCTTRPSSASPATTPRRSASSRSLKTRHATVTLCGVLMHSSLVLTPEGVPLGLAAVKFWTRKKFKGTNAPEAEGQPHPHPDRAEGERPLAGEPEAVHASCWATRPGASTSATARATSSSCSAPPRRRGPTSWSAPAWTGWPAAAARPSPR